MAPLWLPASTFSAGSWHFSSAGASAVTFAMFIKWIWYIYIYIYIYIYVCVLLYIIYTYTYIPYEMAQWCFLAMYFQLESSSAPNLLRASDPVDLWLVHVTADVTRTDGCAVGYPLVKWWFNGG
jgi:hypothetical protein